MSTVAAGVRGEPAVPKAWSWDTVGTFCLSLQARTGCRIRVQPGLDELGLIHSPCDAEPAVVMLSRLARLTGSISTRAGDTTPPTYDLARQRVVAAREEQWRTEPLRWALTEHIRRASLIGDAPEADPAGEKDFYLRRRYVRIALRYAASLSPAQVTQLLDEQDVRVSADVVPDEARKLMLREFRGTDKTLSDDQIEEGVGKLDDGLRTNGVGLKLDSSGTLGQGAVLMLLFGPPRPLGSAGFGLATVPVESLAIPLTRKSPYAFLESGASEPTADDALPPELRRGLAEDLRMPASGSWRDMVTEFGRVTRIPFLSDAYFCRDASFRPRIPAGDIVGKKGQVVGQVLDEMCRRFQYVWWHDKGWCYFRSNRWPHDVVREVPSSLLSRCASSLQTGERLSAADFRGLTAMPWRKMEGLGRIRLDVSKPPQVYPALLKELFTFIGALSPTDQQSYVGKGLEVPVDADLPLESFQKLRRGNRKSVFLLLEQQAQREQGGAIPGWSVTLTLRASGDGGKTGSKRTLTLLFPDFSPCCRPEASKPKPPDQE